MGQLCSGGILRAAVHDLAVGDLVQGLQLRIWGLLISGLGFMSGVPALRMYGVGLFAYAGRAVLGAR